MSQDSDIVLWLSRALWKEAEWVRCYPCDTGSNGSRRNVLLGLMNGKWRAWLRILVNGSIPMRASAYHNLEEQDRRRQRTRLRLLHALGQ